MTQILALIGARQNSRGMPGKNIHPLASYPLLAYSIKAALKTPGINRVIVSTDSPKYAEIAKSYGAETPFLQPPDIATDTSTDYDWISYALRWLWKHEKYQPSLIVHLRPTTPLREPETIEAAIKTFKLASDSTALRSVHEMSESAYKCFEIDIQTYPDELTVVGSSDHIPDLDIDAASRPRQAFPTTYQGNGYVDILKTDFIHIHNRLYGTSVFPFVTARAAEVDTPEDFEYLKYLVAKNRALVNRLFA